MYLGSIQRPPACKHSSITFKPLRGGRGGGWAETDTVWGFKVGLGKSDLKKFHFSHCKVLGWEETGLALEGEGGCKGLQVQVLAGTTAVGAEVLPVTKRWGRGMDQVP